MRLSLGPGLLAAGLLALGGPAGAQSQWQGVTYPPATSRPAASHFLLLDTGGSGRTFLWHPTDDGATGAEVHPNIRRPGSDIPAPRQAAAPR
jgi:hypothetical protein